MSANCSNPECGGGMGDMTGGFDRYTCLVCGRQTDLHGNLLPPDAIFPAVEGFRGGSLQGVRKAE